MAYTTWRGAPAGESGMNHVKTISRTPAVASIDATLGKLINTKVEAVETKADALAG